MKITKEQLKQIIKEELEAVMEVGGSTEFGGTGGFIKDKPAVKKPIDNYHAKMQILKKKYGKISNIPDDEMPDSPGSGPAGRPAASINEEPDTSPREIAKKIGDEIKQMDAWTNIQPDLAKQDIEDMLPVTMGLERLANLLGDMEGYESVAKFIDLMD